MKKRGWTLLASIILLLGIVAGVFILGLIKRPLGPALKLEGIRTSPQPVSTKTDVDKATNEVPATPTGAILADTTTSQPTNTPLPTSAPITRVCGSSGQMSILVVGQALKEEGEYIGAGAIRLVVIDFDHASASILSLPNQLWVDASGLKDPNTPFATLDSIYYKVFLQNNSQPEDVTHRKSTEGLAQAIFDNFGFVPDHYITVLQKPFIQFVDLLGGIDLELTTEIIPENPFDGIYPAGFQHLDGQRTLIFTRLDRKGFNGNDTWGEFERQNMVLKALLKTALKPENWSKAPSLIDQAQKTVLTDLSVEQINLIKCMVEKTGNQVKLLQIEPKMITTDTQGHWLSDVQAIKALISQLYSP